MKEREEPDEVIPFENITGREADGIPSYTEIYKNRVPKMTLSILPCGGLVYALFDGDRLLMSGTQPEMEEWKDILENKEQQAANKEHFEELKQKYLQQLIAGGNSAEKAENFLRQRMPFLFTT